MKDKITITHDEFRDAVANEVVRLLNASEKVEGSPMAGMMATLLVTTFGAALASRLFKDDEEEKKDGTDS